MAAQKTLSPDARVSDKLKLFPTGSAYISQASLFEQPHPVREVSFDNKICVTRPYFALENLRQIQEGYLAARVPVETPCQNELGPITAAEAGRHLAILGSCAAADRNSAEGKHYYLANRAIFRRPRDTYRGEYFGDLQASAMGHLENKRNASADVVLATDAGEPVCTLSVDYHVLTERVFSKLNSASRQEGRETVQNPYSSPCPLSMLDLTGETLTATLGSIRPEQCQGHFDSYPAMPVAILMSTLIRASGQLLDEVVQGENVKYLVREAIVQADGLAFAGEEVDLQVDYAGMDDGEFSFHGQAIAAGAKKVGDLRLRLEVIDNQRHCRW